MLQWTLRDGAHVNLPWALLVKGDIIMVKPGQGPIRATITFILCIVYKKKYIVSSICATFKMKYYLDNIRWDAM